MDKTAGLQGEQKEQLLFQETRWVKEKFSAYSTHIL